MRMSAAAALIAFLLGPACTQPNPTPIQSSPVTAYQGKALQIVGVEFSGLLTNESPTAKTLATGWGFRLGKRMHGAVGVHTALDPKLPPEAFQVRVGTTITITSGSMQGVHWGLHHVGERIALDEPIERFESGQPAYPFRCVMVDVARRYHSPETLKWVMVWSAAARIPYVQLHLTDDQNWMLPWRGKNSPSTFNQHGKPAYTESEIRDLNAFAESCGVTIIPEVDLPGHSSLLIRSNPTLFRIAGSGSDSCINFADPVVVAESKRLLHEAARLFPKSPYIHFGGDEANFSGASANGHFLARMRELGSGADAHTVFTDYIGQLADEVVRLGKKPLVWEGFGPSAFAKQRMPKELVVIAWEGRYYAPDQLEKDGYPIINAGWDPNYVVNHFPNNAMTLVPLERHLQYNPRRFGLVDYVRDSEKEHFFSKSAKLVGGLLCWWEGHEWNTCALLPPRILAHGERLWKGEASRSDYSTFLTRYKRLTQHFSNLGQSGSGNETDRFGQGVIVKGEAWPKPLFELGLSTKRVQHKGYNRLVSLSLPGKDPHFGPDKLTDGIVDSLDSYWLSFPPGQTATIDLGDVQSIRELHVYPFFGIQRPIRYRISISEDNEVWREVVDRAGENPPASREPYVHSIGPVMARYIRFETLRSDQFPPTITRVHEICVY